MSADKPDPLAEDEDPSPSIGSYLAICPSCLRTLLVDTSMEGGGLRLASGQDTTHRTLKELQALKAKRKAMRKQA